MITIYNEKICPTDKLAVVDIKKWWQLAKAVKEVENPCYSRQIGALIVDPNTNSLISSGHNGPPQGCPKNDDPDYLQNVVWPQLTDDEQLMAWNNMRKSKKYQELKQLGANLDGNWFSEFNGNCATCPRKLINAPSGKRLELCTCIHGEVDSIVRANRSVAGCYIFCYCGIPCIECTKVIINSGLEMCFAIDHGRGDYSPYSSRWLFENSAVRLIMYKEEAIWEDK